MCLFTERCQIQDNNVDLSFVFIVPMQKFRLLVGFGVNRSDQFLVVDFVGCGTITFCTSVVPMSMEQQLRQRRLKKV